MRLSVPDMSCGHCKAAVERAIAEKDATASVTVDLSARQVVVETALAAADVIATLAAEGYPAEVLN
ncbi:heavy-metal-associated domain-containing protein [Albidovulum sp.]|uniref:heavy-metal-associated domain-containing protein n=1 Tax=Albidovulum sp. TaxID=1872424 RepID=UPI001DA646D1|nr:heavy-metal-associated domain-containing protein [Paracoccaceae bacterium]MCC0047018.1 heavy-metal-associated domain-containing protein [Defluviimonas sp.]HRV62362.1 heavy-metal-associated domain-containing protein [Albidovulum sp.]MCB2143042.1 heavy-metal-associated domain-containing protein [Paracoccaceae bacterium]MCB2150370.1 heavy-metal-associated domain-containing protein [Paracoccaceae bacterium]